MGLYQGACVMIGRLMEKARIWLKNLDASYFYAFFGEATLGFMFLFYAVLARILGPEQNGVFTAAVSLGGILAALIQFGLPALLTRDVANEPDNGPCNTFLFLVVQIINTVPILMILPFILHMLDFTREGYLICYVVIFAELLRSAKMLWRGIMKGRGWFQTEAVSVGIERLVVVFCSGVVLLLTRNLVLVVATLALARLADSIGIAFYLSRKVRLWAEINRDALMKTYRRAYPFAVHGLLWLLYYQVDIIMLKAIASTEEVGYYGAAYRVLEIFAALPRVVFYVSYTRFAENHTRNPSDLPRQAWQSVHMLLIFVLPSIVIAGYAQPAMMPMIYGPAYLPSIILMAVLLPSLSVKMFSTLSEEYLLATGHEKKLLPLMFIVTASNILANLILIPGYGALGAAIATVISECILCVLGLRLIIRHGLRQLGYRFAGMAVMCLLLAAAPSLLVAGYSLWIAAGLSVLCIIALFFFNTYNRRQV